METHNGPEQSEDLVAEGVKPGALVIAASIIAAIRLRGGPIRPSPKLAIVIAESVQLARLVMRELRRSE
jgi:hypothetical protein